MYLYIGFGGLRGFVAFESGSNSSFAAGAASYVHRQIYQLSRHKTFIPLGPLEVWNQPLQ
jgi:hypothetical protein